MTDIDDAIRRIDEGEDAWNDDDEVVEVEVIHPLLRIVTARLTAEEWDALYEEAKLIGVGPNTLAHKWILERLQKARTGQPSSSGRRKRA